MTERNSDRPQKGYDSGLPATIAALLSLAALFAIVVFALVKGGSFVGLVKEQTFIVQFPVIFGIPFSATISFIVVSLLRYTSGPIEFEAIGFRFKGASGPIVLWVFCFLALVLGIKVLWQDPSVYLKDFFPK